LGKHIRIDPYHASLWWGKLASYTKNSNSEQIYNRLKTMAALDKCADNLQLFSRSGEAFEPVFHTYFQSTYIAPGADKPIRKPSTGN